MRSPVGHQTTHPRRTARQGAAKTRQAARDARTPEEQLAVIQKRLGSVPGKCKEVRKLFGLIGTES